MRPFNFLKNATLLTLVLMVTACGGGGGSTTDTSNTTNTNDSTGIDITVTSLTVPNTANAGNTFTVTYVVRNSGSELAGWFNTAIYLSYDNAIIAGDDKSSATSSVSILNPNESITISKSITIPPNLHTGTFYLGVKADSSDTINESNESNNIYLVSISVTGTSCTEDSYEQNDSHSTAIPLTQNTPLQLNHCDDDSDWFVFSASADMNYGFSTSKLGAKANTKIELYDTDGTTLLRSNTNSGVEELASRLAWTAPATGDYYVKVGTEYGMENTGADTEYMFTISDASVDLGITNASFNGDSWLYAGGTRWVIFYPFNNGFTDSGSFTVKAYMSTDTVIDSSDTLVGVYDLPSLAAGSATEFFNVDVATPQNTAPGTYYLGFIADADNTVAEYNEQNNLSNVLQFDVVAVTDCTLDNYEDDDFQLYANVAAFGEVQTHNFCDDEKDWLMFNGLQDSSYVVKTVSLGGDANFSVYDPDGNYLGGGGQGSCCTSSGTFEFIAPTTGTYYVKVWSSLNNGGASTNYTVAVYDDLPDMNVSYLSYDNDIHSYYPGGIFNVWPQTNNSGFEAAPPSETGVYLSTDQTLDAGDTYLGSRPISAMDPFQQDAGWSLFTIPATTAPGDYYLIANADDKNQVMEIYEDNNSLTYPYGTITVSPSLCAADAYEEDDTADNATLVTPGTEQSRNLCDDPYDWMKIDLTQGESIVFQDISTYGVTLEFYDTDKQTLLDTSFLGHVFWKATSSGTYYVRVRNGATSGATGSDYTLSVENCDNDQYEDDSIRSNATMIATGESQTHNMCDGTTDYVAFNAIAGVKYTISTSGLEANIDTVIELYDSIDAFSSIASSDNAKPSTLASEITWTAPADGVYYVLIRGGHGTQTGYTITVQ